MANYTTRQGDTWDVISLRLYGAERFMDRLIDANRDYREVGAFSAGIVLVAPDIPEAERETTLLPPWRRNA